MAFKNKKVTITYVVCDKCGKQVEIGKDLNFDNRMNGCICTGFTFKEENGVFKNYCKECKKEMS